MIYKAILLFVQKYLWSRFIKGKVKANILKVAGLSVVLVSIGAFVSSILFDMTFVDGLWLVWSYVGDGAKVITRSLMS